MRSVSGVFTWLSCVGLCMAGCVLGCCLTPFCMGGLKDSLHYCTHCDQLITRRNQVDLL